MRMVERVGPIIFTLLNNEVLNCITVYNRSGSSSIPCTRLQVRERGSEKM